MAKISYSTTETTIYVKLTSLDTSYAGGTRRVYWYLDDVYYTDMSISNGVSNAAGYTFTGLSPGTRYLIECYVYANGSQLAYFSQYATTDEEILEEPTLTATSDSSSITARISDKGDYSYFKFSLYTYSGTAVYTGDGFSTSTSRYFPYLSSDTRYTIYCGYSNNTSTSAGTLSYNIWTDSINVDTWSWTSSTARSKAYSALTSNGSTGNFSYSVWNEMCDKVKEVLDATGGSWDSTYASLSATKMTSSSKTLTAKRFNSLRYNIQKNVYVNASTVPAATTGDIVYGSYFTYLMTRVNVWINSL